MLPPTHPCLATFSGPSIPQLTLFPFRFLTPSVLTFFRPSQFWVLTTQPLFFFSFSSRFRLTAAFPMPVSALASSVSSFSPAWFPVPSFQIPVLSFTVRFLSLFPVSLPQPFHRCLPSVFTFGIFHFRLSFFRPFVFRFQLLSLLFFFSPSSRFRLTAAFPVPVSALASSVSSFSPAWFPVPSFQIPVLSSTVGFLSPYPDSLPQLFLRCLPCALAFGLSPSAPLPFVRVPSGSGYLASVSSFPLSSRFHLTAISSVRPFHFRFFGFPRSFRPGFPCLLSRFFVLGLSVCFLSPFPDSLPQLFLRCLPCAFAFGLFPFIRLSFVRLFSGSGYSASVSSFPLSSRFHLTVISSVRPFHFRFFGFPRSFRPGFPCLLSRFFVLGSLFVSFHPSRLRSHSCSTDASLLLSLLGFPLSSVFFRPLPFGSDYSAFRSFFSLLPVFPCRRFLRCCPFALRLPRSSSSVRPVAMPLFRFWYSAYCASFLPRCLASQWLLQRLGLPCGLGLFTFAFALGSGYLASGFLPFGFFPFAVSLGNV